MEQAAVNLLSTMAAAKTAVPNVGRNSNAASAAAEDFQAMLDKRQKSDDKPVENKQAGDSKTNDQEKAKETEKAEDASTKQEQTEDAAEDDTVVQAQAIWAAMSVMKPEVVQAEAPAEGPVAEVVAETVEAVPEVRVEAPVVEQPAVEEVPQQAQATVAEAPVQEAEAEAEALPQEAGTGTEVKAEAKAVTEEVRAKTEGPEVRTEQTAESRDSSKSEAETVETDAKPVFRDVESAPIKVGEAPVTEKAPEVKPLERQVMEPLVQAMENGETKVVVNLTPENLGSVRIELVHTESGALRVLLSADSTETRGLLEKHVMGLQAMLSKNDHESVQVEVERQQESQQHNGHYDDQNSSKQQEQQSGQQQEQRRGRESDQRDTRDFLQQLRLGLVPADRAE